MIMETSRYRPGRHPAATVRYCSKTGHYRPFSLVLNGSDPAPGTQKKSLGNGPDGIHAGQTAMHWLAHQPPPAAPPAPPSVGTWGGSGRSLSLCLYGPSPNESGLERDNTPADCKISVRPPLFVVLGLPVVAPDHTAADFSWTAHFQGLHGNTADICPGRIQADFAIVSGPAFKKTNSS